MIKWIFFFLNHIIIYHVIISIRDTVINNNINYNIQLGVPTKV